MIAGRKLGAYATWLAPRGGLAIAQNDARNRSVIWVEGGRICHCGVALLGDKEFKGIAILQHWVGRRSALERTGWPTGIRSVFSNRIETKPTVLTGSP